MLQSIEGAGEIFSFVPRSFLQIFVAAGMMRTLIRTSSTKSEISALDYYYIVLV